MIKILAKRQTGFTLLELLIASTVITIIMMILMNFLSSQVVDNAVKNTVADMQLQTQNALNVINRDIKHASSVQNTNSLTDTSPPTTWSSSASTLILASPAETLSGTLLYTDASEDTTHKNNFIYFRSGNTLYKRILANSAAGNKDSTTCQPATPTCPADIKLIDNVSAFTITYFNPTGTDVTATNPSLARSISINVQLTKKVFTKTLSTSSNIRTVLRNE